MLLINLVEADNVLTNIATGLQVRQNDIAKSGFSAIALTHG